jgi:hypothetical protein
MSKHLVIFENQKVFMANRFKAYTHEVLTDEAGQEEWSHHSMVLRRVPGHTIERIFWKTETGDYSLEENQNVTQHCFLPECCCPIRWRHSVNDREITE